MRGRTIVGEPRRSDPDAPDLSSKSFELAPSSCKSKDMFEGGAWKMDDDELRRFRKFFDGAGVDENPRVTPLLYESSETFSSPLLRDDSPARGGSRNACVVEGARYLEELVTGAANRS
jgi:hypothetical protein